MALSARSRNGSACVFTSHRWLMPLADRLKLTRPITTLEPGQGYFGTYADVVTRRVFTSLRLALLPDDEAQSGRRFPSRHGQKLRARPCPYHIDA